MDAHSQGQIYASSTRRKKKPRLRYRRMRGRQCAAAVQGTTAAKLYLTGQFPSVAAAALYCGVSAAYARAAVIVLQSENATMLERVLRGRVPLLAAAKQLKQVAALVGAYRTARAADRVAFAKAIGPTTLFDSALVPAI